MHIVTVFSAAMVVIGGVGLVGSALGRSQRVAMTIPLPAPPEEVWARIAGDRRQAWRSDLAGVDLVDDRRWIERPRRGGPVAFRVVREEPFHSFAVAFEGSGFKGEWDGTVRRSGTGSELVFEEEVVVENPYLRVVSRLFFGPDRAMAVYRADLERSLRNDASR